MKKTITMYVILMWLVYTFNSSVKLKAPDRNPKSETAAVIKINDLTPIKENDRIREEIKNRIRSKHPKQFLTKK